MAKIGDLCPLFFSPIKDKFENDINYIQRFHSSDTILLQIFVSDTSETPTLSLLDVVSGKTQSVSAYSYYEHSLGVIMVYYILTGLPDSIYALSALGKTSEPFMVCSSDEILKETVLIRYSHRDNNSAFDNIFWIGSEQQVFEFRVEAGFKPTGYAPKVDNEQYRNQMQEVIDLYAIPYDVYTLSVGNAAGVPYWFARFLNRILCLSMVEIDGTKYVRSESSVPELSQVLEDSQLFHVSIALERQQNDIAGVGGAPESASSSSIVGFAIDNPTDGQMLQYDADKSAFANVTTVEI